MLRTMKMKPLNIKKNKLKVESALLSALLVHAGVKFDVNFHVSVFVIFHKLELSQSHCF